ncbi:MAG: hypothetical protein KJ060_01660 [Candidatus Hydrogenedentes bacterium]|nr:hypothetical protein [Candidatus Hydrogenedentota bacterium]
MPRIVALVRDNTALKLMLAGIPVENTHDARTAEARLDELLESDTSVVIVQEAFRSAFSEFFAERLRRHKGLPLIVYCPAFEEEESNVDAYLSAVLKPAVGYEIRLE